MHTVWMIYMVYVFSSTTIGCAKLVIVILSQSNKYHEALAENLRHNISAQAEAIQEEHPIVYLSHIDFPHIGAWAITPLLPLLQKQHAEECLWIVFFEDRTQIKLHEFNEMLKKYDCSKEIWFGHALYDAEPTIIHHFAFYENTFEFKYPNTASGIVLSNTLVKMLVNRLKTETINSDFAIDHGFELALFIWNNNKGPTLTHEPKFCINDNKGCSTFPELFKPCQDVVTKKSLYFAVKTCKKFHDTRIPIVQKTWGLEAHHINFFSDFKDNLFLTISLGIPNTEKGHCAKTFKIIQYVSNHIKNIPDIKWVIIADDDTILSVAQLQELLTCYNENDFVALGERYGYNLHEKQGYNYITGGGGIVFSRLLLDKLALTKACECPSPSSPDDMFLGICLARLGIEITHSPFFHQARSIDYPPEYLQHQHIVSFHKHWMINPINVYNEWFTERQEHIEL